MTDGDVRRRSVRARRALRRRGGSGSPASPTAGFRELLQFFALYAPLVLALRALVVSHFDYSIAESLVVGSPSVPFVVTTLVWSTPGYLYLAGLAICYRWGAGGHRMPQGRRSTLIVVAVLLTIPQLLASTPLLAALEVGLLPVAVLAGRVPDRISNPLKPLLAGALLAYLALVALPRTLWLPAERAEIHGQPRTFYVLDESDSDLVVFHPRRVAIERIAATSVNNRQFCVSGTRQSVGELLLGNAEQGMPICD